jgi:hypothetical protein
MSPRASARPVKIEEIGGLIDEQADRCGERQTTHAVNTAASSLPGGKLLTVR